MSNEDVLQPHFPTATMSTTTEPAGGGAAVADKTSGDFMAAALIFLVVSICFVFALYLYARRHWFHDFFPDAAAAGGRSRPAFAGDPAAAHRRRGLDPEVLKSLPVNVFKDAGELECAVCLADIAGGELVRFLPKCRHGFHVQCIDMWFHSHSTCPLCRSPVSGDLSPAPAPELVLPSTATSPEFPTNQLVWGTQDRIGSAAPERVRMPPEGVLAIGIPSRMVGSSWVLLSPTSPLPMSRLPAPVETKAATSSGTEEAMCSPSGLATMASERLRSLTRLLSFGRRNSGAGAGAGASCSSPACGDIEQGRIAGGDHKSLGS